MARNISITVIPTQIQNLRTTSVTQTTIALAWDVYPGATGYEIRRNGTLVLTTASTTYSNSGHTAGTSYTYAVRPVVGGSGVASAQASIVVVTTGATSYVPTHYVTADAPTTVSQAAFNAATSAASPCSLVCALTYAVAGNRVQVGPGVYQRAITSSSGWTSTFTISGSGTSSAPIVFFAQYPATSVYLANPSLMTELRNGGTFAGEKQPVFGTNSFTPGARRYHVWDGFYTHGGEGRAPPKDTQGMHLICGSDIVVRRCVFDQWIPDSATSNWNCVFSQQDTNSTGYRNTVEDNVFRLVYGVQGNHNMAAVETYGVWDMLIQNNLFDGSRHAIFMKGYIQNYTIRNNHIRNCAGTALDLNNGHTSRWSYVHNNLIENCATSGAYPVLVYDNSAGVVQNIEVYNNTFAQQIVDINGGVVLITAQPTSPNIFRDNIVACVNNGAGPLVNAWYVSNLDAFPTWNHNVYYDGGAAPGFTRNGSTSQITLAAWQSAMSRDANSIAADPQFVNAAGGNYRLQAGSPALTASSTGGPVGCYITGSETIGVRT